MEYLIGSIILSVGLMGYAIWWDLYKSKQVTVPIIFDQKKYDRINRGLDKHIAKMWELSERKK
jgi:hypothetical protein